MARLRGLAPILGMLMVVSTALAGCESPSSTERSGPSLADSIAAHLGTDPDYQQIRAILVTHDGQTAFEHYYQTTPETTRNVASVTKSLLSTLVGIALGEGLIPSIDAQLSELISPHAAEMSPDMASVTLRQLLTMTSGLPGSSVDEELGFTASDNWIRAILHDSELSSGSPGFAYSDAGAHLVAAIVQQATGGSVLRYARDRLFDPLGIDTRPAAQPVAVARNADAYSNAGFAWPVDPQGLNLGWTLMKMSPEDMVKLGQLFLDGGVWQGHQVVPADWVRDATSSQVDVVGEGNPGSAYGYLWWVDTFQGHPTYLAWGYGGQLVEVIPDLGVVVVVSTDVDPDDPNAGLSPNQISTLVDVTILPHLEADESAGGS